jgi:cytochrome d ubiquinol oxidase subunit II
MGGLFAGFPNVYATIFSGFYTLLMFLIAGLIFRAVAIEFRSKHESKRWRSTWDCVFSFASMLVAFVMGLILGNMIEGIPLNASQDYVGTFALFFRPYSLLAAVTVCALFTMHGTIYLYMKTEGETHKTVGSWINWTIGVFVLCYAVATPATLVYMPHMADRFKEAPALMIIPLLTLLAILNIPHQVRKGNGGWAFVSSSISIGLLLALFGIGTFPTLVPSTINPEINSLTIYNTASSPKTLTILLTVVAIGIPLVLAYGFWVYRIFRGKVVIGKSSY